MTTTLAGIGRAPGALLDDDPSNAAMFLFREEIAGETWWGHMGYWGTTAYTCPARDVTIVTGHQRSDMPEGFDRLASSVASPPSSRSPVRSASAMFTVPR
jgi:hypothetical protein